MKKTDTNTAREGIYKRSLLSEDEDSFGTQGRKTRIRKEIQENVSQTVELYLQAYQLILRKQCHALVHTIGLPAELETVVKDLWALRQQMLKHKTDTTSDEDTVFSSQPQSETETELEGDGGRREYKIRGKAMPTLIETLGLLYHGMVLLRLPISMGDISCWAIREDIPFIRASPLQPDHLRKTIHNLSTYYTHHFKLIFPPINAHLLLYKQIRYLALPITLHPLTLIIASIMSIDFTFPVPGRRQRTSSLPELQLTCLLVIATKLYHPFSGPPRHARSFADPAALALDWSVWIAALKAHDEALIEEHHFPRGSEINVSEKDALKLTGEQIDEYLDYFERTFIDPERVEQKERGLPKQLLDMFPTHRLDGSEPPHYSYQTQVEKEQIATEQTLKTVMGSLKLRPITADEDDVEEVRRIGSLYKRYRRVEDLDGVAKAFHERVAQRVGVSVKTLVLAVLQIEGMLIKWREMKMKEKEKGVEEDVETKTAQESGNEDSYSD
ncbi:RNA polymerase I-specific transcription initiation factor RRN7, partial [Lecanoromycetidae sp. Uapishka_2]